MYWKYRVSEIKFSFWKKIHHYVMKKAYPWWDYSYFYEMASEWLFDASKNFKEKGTHVSHEKEAKEILIAAELCKRIAEGYSSENSYRTAFGCKIEDKDFDFRIELSEEERRRYRKWAEYQKRDDKFYLEYLGKMLKKYSKSWWD